MSDKDLAPRQPPQTTQASPPSPLHQAMGDAETCAEAGGPSQELPQEASNSSGNKSRAERQVLVVTGLSGAGRTITLKTLEDLGYEAVDNLPLKLFDAALAAGEPGQAMALGVDIRTRGFDVEAILARLMADTMPPDIRMTLLFIDCEDEVLRRRFTETRRRHPLAVDRPILDGIRLERRLILPLRQRADVVIDTSEMTPNDLKRALTGRFQSSVNGLSVFVTSFSFRHGVPREADLVFDVRFLRNPHYQPDLKPRTGQDPAVAAFVAADPIFPEFLSRLTRLLAPLLPRYEQEGKSYLTIAVGCTGGRHRSVFIAERLGAWLQEQLGPAVLIGHRDLPETVPSAPSPAVEAGAPVDDTDNDGADQEGYGTASAETGSAPHETHDRHDRSENRPGAPRPVPAPEIDIDPDIDAALNTAPIETDLAPRSGSVS